MRRFTKEWLMRQRVGKGERKPAPFPRIPTRVAYFTNDWSYIGKPSLAAFRKYIRISNANQNRRDFWYMTCEFDRDGLIRKWGTRLYGQCDRSLAAFYYVGIDTRFDTPGQMVSRRHSVRKLSGNYVYVPLNVGDRMPTTYGTDYRDWLVEKGWYEPTRGNKAAL